MKPYDWQIEEAKKALEILRKYRLVYLAFEERVGKTPTTLALCEMTKLTKPILIITKKKALEGWRKFLEGMELKKQYVLTNYHQVYKFTNKEFGLVVLDEAHSYLAGFPKFGKIWQTVAKITRVQRLPIIYLSATPHAQGYHLIYPQLKLSVYSPFEKFKNYYHWHKHYGIPYTIWVHGQQVKQWDCVKTEEVKKAIQHLFLTKTRQEIGHTQEPIDIIHYIPLLSETRKWYNTLLQDRILFLPNYPEPLVADSAIKLRTALYQIEGGTAKIEGKDLVLPNEEKIEFIKKRFGDTKDTVIMCHFIAEREKLQKHFKNAIILSSNAHAEGVDLSMYDNLIIYSMDFSVAKYTQRRARQCNLNREKPIKVHYLLTKNAISEQVYETVVKKKQNFVDKLFKKITI